MIQINKHLYRKFFMFELTSYHFVLALFSIALFAAENASLSVFPNSFFISVHKPSDTFKELLRHHSIIYQTETLDDIVKATQQCWLRTDNSERWHLARTEADPKSVESFKKLQLINAIEPQNSTFDYAVIFGSTARTMRKTVAYLLELYTKKNIRFNEIIFLVGERKRDPEIESEDILKNKENRYLINKQENSSYTTLPSNETEIAQMIWNQAELGDLFKLPVTFVNTPTTIKNNEIKRPTTVDTVLEWKNKHTIKPGSRILAIAAQPHLGRQDIIIKTALPDCLIETVGPRKKKIKFPLFVDAIARQLYTLLNAQYQK